MNHTKPPEHDGAASQRCPAENLIETAEGAFWLTCCLEIGHSGEHYGRPLSWGDGKS